MATWQDEFIRLSELHQQEVQKWIDGANNANAVINTGEEEKEFMRRWLSAGLPSQNEEMPY